jgi:hypothetical protein
LFLVQRLLVWLAPDRKTGDSSEAVTTQGGRL